LAEFKQTSDATKGGLFVGDDHDEGGIPAIVTDTGQLIEVEGGEAIINKEATSKHWKLLSKINQSAGNGVPIPPPDEADKVLEKFNNGGKITTKEKKIVFDKWRKLVNMTYTELSRYYHSTEGKASDLPSRQSAEWTLKMKKTNWKNWTDDMWNNANKQLSFIYKTSYLQGDFTDIKGKKTEKYKALLIYGNDPKKKNAHQFIKFMDADRERIKYTDIIPDFDNGGLTNSEAKSMVMWHEENGNWFTPKGQIYLWYYDIEGAAAKLSNEEFGWVFYPLTSMQQAFPPDYIPPLKSIWTKKFQKDIKGSEHLLGVIKAYLIEKDGTKELFIDMMSVDPKKMGQGIMTAMINELRDSFDLNQEQVTFSKLTTSGEKFTAKKTYGVGGGIINYKIGDIIKWGKVLLEIKRIGRTKFDAFSSNRKQYPVNISISSITGLATDTEANKFIEEAYNQDAWKKHPKYTTMKETKKIEFTKEALKVIPDHQLRYLKSTNFAEMEDAINTINDAVLSVPSLYEQDEVTDKMIYLHYFLGNQDWYVTEYSRNSGEMFGYANLGYGAELGYMSLSDFTKNGKVELDFYFDPQLGSEIDTDKESAFDKQNKNGFKEFYSSEESRNCKSCGDPMEVESGNCKSCGDPMELDEDEAPYDFYFHPPNKNGTQLMNRLEKLEFGLTPHHRFRNSVILTKEFGGTFFEFEAFDNTTEFKFSVLVPTDFREVLKNSDFAFNPAYTTNDGKLLSSHKISDNIEEKLRNAMVTYNMYKSDISLDVNLDIKTYKNPFELNKAIERWIDKNVGSLENAPKRTYSTDERVFIRNYTGYGGLGKYGELSVGSMFEFFTPQQAVKSMWALAYKYGYSINKSVLETSVGTGEFLQFASPQCRKLAYEINMYSAIITKILYPTTEVRLAPFESMFIKDNWTIKGKTDNLEKFDMVIGNCPYGNFEVLDDKASRYLLGMGEKDYTKAHNYVEYFLRRSLDVLNPNGLIVMIVGAELKNGGKMFLDGGESPVKEYMNEHAVLLDAYRLPDSTFERTGVTTDILVIQKK